MTAEATIPLRLLASFLIFVPAVFGLVLQTILGVALYRGWRIFRQNSFYLITFQLLWCDVYALILDLYAAFPMILTGMQYMGDSVPLYYIPLAFEGVAFNVIFMLSLLLTINRFLLFIFPALHSKIFTSLGTKIAPTPINKMQPNMRVESLWIIETFLSMSALVWLYVCALIAMSNVFGCRKEFSEDYFYFWFKCEISNENSLKYNEFLYTHSCVIPCIMIVMYSIIYIRIKLYRYGFKMNSTTSLKKEMKYLVQTVLISILIAVDIAAFISLPYLRIDGYAQFYINMFFNLIIIANNLMRPIIILSFNLDVRQKLSRTYLGSREFRVQYITFPL